MSSSATVMAPGTAGSAVWIVTRDPSVATSGEGCGVVSVISCCVITGVRVVAPASPLADSGSGCEKK